MIVTVSENKKEVLTTSFFFVTPLGFKPKTFRTGI